MDTQSLAHSKWNCKYHIVFAPKYRRQIIYGKIKADIGKIIRKLCEHKGVEIIEANSCSTPSNFTDVIAYPSREESKIRRNALPMVMPYPGSSGRNSNFPENAFSWIMITLSGFWNANIAMKLLFRI